MDWTWAIQYNIPVLSAFLLGLLTAIAPCPMATNIAAIAYVSQQTSSKKRALITGVLYTLGRMFSYSVIGILIVLVGVEVSGISNALQKVLGEQVLGGILIASGIFMFFINRFSFGKGSGKMASLGARFAGWGLGGGFLLGALFALAFCPYSAVLFFIGLMTLALKTPGGAGLPAIYAIGTGLPVLIFGLLISMGISKVSSWLNAFNRAEKALRIAVALIFIGAGIYLIVHWLTVK
jgi:cytochrome c-type biogenesis protein